MATSRLCDSDATSFLDGISNTEFCENKPSTMQKLEQRTSYLEKKVEDLETIVGNMELGKPPIEDDICDDGNDTDVWLPPKSSTIRSSPEEQVEMLREMFESVEDMLRSPDYDEYLQYELSLACPNYMTVFQTAKRDLLRNDCGIVLAGETSAGKTTLINLLVGNKLFVTGNLATTGTITRIRNSEKMAIKCFAKDEVPLREEEALDVKTLKSFIKRFTNIRKIPKDLQDINFVDVYLPVSFLKGNVIIVDTPGIGENDRLDKILIDFLPHAVSFVFVINAKNAGGIHEDRLSRILKTIMENREKMPCFDPREAMFLTNQWDIIENDDPSSDEDNDEKTERDDQHTQTWKLIQRKLENGWGLIDDENVFRVSLREVDKGVHNCFTEEYERFKISLKKAIEKNKNKRVDFYYRFLKNFIQNAERGIRTRLKALEMSEEEYSRVMIQNTTMIQDLDSRCKKKRTELEMHKNKTIAFLTEELYLYLRSDDGREEILNPPGEEKICEVMYLSLVQEVRSRIKSGIKRWCSRHEVKSIIEDADTKIRKFVREVGTRVQEIEIALTGIDTGVQYSNFVTTFLVGRLIRPSTIIYATFLVLMFYPILLLKVLFDSSKSHRQLVDNIYDECLTQMSLSDLTKCFKNSFGVEYGKVIESIFDIYLPNLLNSLLVTNERALGEIKDIKEKQDSYGRLNVNIQKIQDATDKYERKS